MLCCFFSPIFATWRSWWARTRDYQQSRSIRLEQFFQVSGKTSRVVAAALSKPWKQKNVLLVNISTFLDWGWTRFGTSSWMRCRRHHQHFVFSCSVVSENYCKCPFAGPQFPQQAEALIFFWASEGYSRWSWLAWTGHSMHQLQWSREQGQGWKNQGEFPTDISGRNMKLTEINEVPQRQRQSEVQEKHGVNQNGERFPWKDVAGPVQSCTRVFQARGTDWEVTTSSEGGLAVRQHAHVNVTSCRTSRKKQVRKASARAVRGTASDEVNHRQDIHDAAWRGLEDVSKKIIEMNR